MSLHVYQIGLGKFGRYGMEKFLGMEKNLDSVDIKLEGLCEEDREKLGNAIKFANSRDSDVKGFSSIERMYAHAAEMDEDVLIYDAGSSQLHAENIVRSLNHDFYHIAEKPPSLTREGFLNEKNLSKNRDVFWKVDFIERENPVVQKTKELLQGELIEDIKIFRENSIGAEKINQPVKRSGVKGGDILDKMFHEIYLLDFLESADEEINPKLVKSDAKYFMPKKESSDSLMNIYGGKADEINEETATGQTHAKIKNGSINIELNSSWMGLSDRSRTFIKSFEGVTGNSLSKSKLKKAQDGKFIAYEETRFFVIDGSISLVGDMLNKKLYNLDTGEEIETPSLLQDPLYRVLEKAVLDASKNVEVEEKDKTLEFSELIFDIRDNCIEDAGDFYTELDKSRQKINQLIFSEKPESIKK